MRFILGVFSIICLSIISCSTNKPTFDQLINNKDSMTKSLKGLNQNLSIEVLKTGRQSQNYVRISSLKLDNTPVIVAISKTKITNKWFCLLLVNANSSPIGNKLFAPDSEVKRGKMIITKIYIEDIKDPVIIKYLNKLGSHLKEPFIIMRKSSFYYHEEDMDLIEYILPSINQFIK